MNSFREGKKKTTDKDADNTRMENEKGAERKRKNAISEKTGIALFFYLFQPNELHDFYLFLLEILILLIFYPRSSASHP